VTACLGAGPQGVFLAKEPARACAGARDRGRCSGILPAPTRRRDLLNGPARRGEHGEMFCPASCGVLRRLGLPAATLRKSRPGCGEPRRGRRAGRFAANPRGSALLLALLLSALLSVLLLGSAGAMLLAVRMQTSLEETTELFYLAEAALARGKAYCLSVSSWPHPEETAPGSDPETGGTQPDSPIGRWVSWGRGRFFLAAYDLDREAPAPALAAGSGILLVATAAIGEDREKKLCLLLEDPPSCRTMAWWEPE
jgi:hypothetical protein